MAVRSPVRVNASTGMPAIGLQDTRLFAEAPVAGGLSVDRSEEYQSELRSYVRGVTLAFGLTGAPFALVYWSVLPQFWICVAIGLFALIQIGVHISFFLHGDPPRQTVDDFHLMLLSALILVLMVGGSIWILANVAARMH